MKNINLSARSITASLIIFVFSIGYGSFVSANGGGQDACGSKFTYEKTSDFSDSRVVINFESSDKQIDVSAGAGYKVNKVWLDVESDGNSGFFQYATGPINNFNPNPGDDIDKAKVEVEKVCVSPTATPSPTTAQNSKKVTICHATSSETNPYNTIVVSENAIGGHFENPGTPKAGHEDDLYFDYETTCPGPQPTVTLTPTNQPTPTEIPVPTITEVPLPTPTTFIPFPTEVEVPVATPTPGNGSILFTPTPTQVVEVEPTAAPTSTPSATLTPTSAPVGGGSSDTGTVSGTSSSSSSSTPGQVLGASTASLPNTGSFYDILSLFMICSGGMLMAVSLSSYAKATKKS